MDLAGHNVVMALLPSPSALIGLTRSAAGQVIETAAAAATVPARLFGLLGQTELLVNRIALTAERADALVEQVTAVMARVERVTADAERTVAGATAVLTRSEQLIDRVETVTTGADKLMTKVDGVTTGAEQIMTKVEGVTADAAQAVTRASGTADEAQKLLDGYGPTLEHAAPLITRFVQELSPEEVAAAIRMVDQLPRLREHLTDDVLPLLGKLDQVGPDLHSLLEVTNDLHLAIVGLPGLKRLRRRGAERMAEEEDLPDGR